MVSPEGLDSHHPAELDDHYPGLRELAVVKEQRTGVDFLDAIGRPDLKEVITSKTPMVVISMEMVPGLIVGGLGALEIDRSDTEEQAGLASIGVTVLLDNWRQALNSQFWQEEIPFTPNLEDLGYKRVADVTIFGNEGKEEKLDVYVQKRGHHTSIGLRGNLGQLYQGDSYSELRLLQDMALGFGGIKALVKLKDLGEIAYEDAASINLNESQTVFFGLAYLNAKVQMGQSFDQALAQTREKILFTNHTLVQAATASYPKDWFERYVFNNLSVPVRSWVERLFEMNGRTGYLNLSSLMFELAEKHNGVSKRHAEIASKRFEKLDGSSAEFKATTNGINMKKWTYQQFLFLYQAERIIDHYTLPTEDHSTRLDALDYSQLGMIKMQAKKDLLVFLQRQRVDQYGKHIEIPQDAKIAGWARRWAGYKRPEMIFWDLNWLAGILEQKDMHLLIGGKTHPDDWPMKEKLNWILSLINEHSTLRSRVHFISDHDIELEKYLVAGADIWLNTPEDGYDNPLDDQEACHTSGLKAMSNLTTIISTRSGVYADTEEEPYLKVSGRNYEEQARSLYFWLDQAADILGDTAKWGSQVVGQLKVFLPIISSARMEGDYIDIMHPNPRSRIPKESAVAAAS